MKREHDKSCKTLSIVCRQLVHKKVPSGRLMNEDTPVVMSGNRKYALVSPNRHVDEMGLDHSKF
jgi:hypothetical protein